MPTAGRVGVGRGREVRLAKGVLADVRAFEPTFAEEHDIRAVGQAGAETMDEFDKLAEKHKAGCPAS